jgi:hypothetical protein
MRQTFSLGAFDEAYMEDAHVRIRNLLACAVLAALLLLPAIPGPLSRDCYL